VALKSYGEKSQCMGVVIQPKLRMRRRGVLRADADSSR